VPLSYLVFVRRIRPAAVVARDAAGGNIAIAMPLRLPELLQAYLIATLLWPLARW